MSSQFNDSDEDIALPTRRASQAAYAADNGHETRAEDRRPAEREVTLNTGIVLGLFFALALLCAVFFGFGYSIGHKSVTNAAAAEPENPAASENIAPVAKPAAGSPAKDPVPEYVSPAGAGPVPVPKATPANVVTVPITREADASETGGSRTTAPVVRTPPAVAVAPTPAPVTTPAPGGAVNYVQVAAVSHQEDADVLLSSLRRRGYVVQMRSEPADKLIHVQVGPFNNRKEAEAMRQKLAGDGYNAFIK